MIDHVGLEVSDYLRSKDFYPAALAPLGIDLMMEFEGRIGGFGRESKPFFWLRQGEPAAGIHVAFAAPDSDTVDAFYTAAIGAGGEDNGPPGLRTHYHPDYYGAFVRDPDGHSVEAVHHGETRGGENRIDHLWIRVRDLDASRRFYETVAPVVGLRVKDGSANRFHVAGASRSFPLVRDDPTTENVHVAFPATDRATVEAFHRAALEAGFRDNGGPGETRYHPGYYSASRRPAGRRCIAAADALCSRRAANAHSRREPDEVPPRRDADSAPLVQHPPRHALGPAACAASGHWGAGRA